MASSSNSARCSYRSHGNTWIHRQFLWFVLPSAICFNMSISRSVNDAYAWWPHIHVNAFKPLALVAIAVASSLPLCRLLKSSPHPRQGFYRHWHIAVTRQMNHRKRGSAAFTINSWTCCLISGIRLSNTTHPGTQNPLNPKARSHLRRRHRKSYISNGTFSMVTHRLIVIARQTITTFDEVQT